MVACHLAYMQSRLGPNAFLCKDVTLQVNRSQICLGKLLLYLP